MYHLKSQIPKGQDLFTKLLKKTDILIENFRPGVLEKLGFPWEVLQKINHRLILVRISGFGQSGPYVNKPAFDRIGMAIGGMSHVTGFPDGPPIRPGLALTDYMSGMFGVIGTLFAIYNRDIKGEGKGQIVDSSLYESSLRVMESAIADYGHDGVIKGRDGNRHISTIPSGHYLTKDRQYLSLAVAGNRVFAAFADAVGKPELKFDERFNTANGRHKHREELERITEEWIKVHTIDECIEIFEGFVPCSKVYTVDDMFKDSHFASRENIIKISTSKFGEICMQGIVPKLSETPGEVKWAGQDPGASNEEIYINDLKLTKRELRELQEDGVI